MHPEHWQDANTKCLGMLVDGRTQKTVIRKRGSDTSVLLVMNGYEKMVEFTLPEFGAGPQWTLLIDTNLSKLNPASKFSAGDAYQVMGRSILLFKQ